MKEIVVRIMIRLLYKGAKYHEKNAELLRRKGLKIGKNCRFYSRNFSSEPYLITIGDHVTVTDNVRFITHDGGVWVLRGMYEDLKDADLFGEIKIGNNVFIGNNAVILPGISIADNVVVAAGSIVSKSLEGNAVYGGIPAKKITSIEDYRSKHEDYFQFTKHMNGSEKKKFLMSNDLMHRGK